MVLPALEHICVTALGAGDTPLDEALVERIENWLEQKRKKPSGPRTRVTLRAQTLARYLPEHEIPLRM